MSQLHSSLLILLLQMFINVQFVFTFPTWDIRPIWTELLVGFVKWVDKLLLLLQTVTPITLSPPPALYLFSLVNVFLYCCILYLSNGDSDFTLYGKPILGVGYCWLKTRILPVLLNLICIQSTILVDVKRMFVEILTHKL